MAELIDAARPRTLTIWADADSLPREARAMLGRRAATAKPGRPVKVIFVANRRIPLPTGPNINATIVDSSNSSGTDGHILVAAQSGDIIVTRDIPLAASALDAGLQALNDRGERWNRDSLRERLSLRDHMTTLRQQGLADSLSKTRTYGPKDLKAFAAALDQAIQAHFSAVAGKQ
jgi:hypothetical protein